MPKLTNKHNQDKGSVAAESEHSVSNAGEAEEDQQHPIPFGASLYWEIPGDIPGASRRCVPLPAEPALPKMPGAPVTQTTAGSTGNVNSPDQSPDVSAYRKIRTNEPDNAAIVPVTETNQTRPSARLSDSSADALASQVDTDSLKTSAVAKVTSVASDVSDEPCLVTSAHAVKRNSAATASYAPSSPAETPEPNAQAKSPIMPASDTDKPRIPGDTDAMELAADRQDFPARQGTAQGIQSGVIQPLGKMHTAPLADSKNTEAVNWQNMATQSQTEYPPVANHQQSQSNEKAKKNYVIPVLLALPLLLFLAGTGYDYLFDSEEQRDVVIKQTESQAPLSDTPEPVAVSADSEANAQVKVIEISVGKLDQYAISGIRMITHVVVRGDTLWDIAETYHDNPWRYPELAERSKIKNPDLIYPGDLVQIHIKITEQESS